MSTLTGTPDADFLIGLSDDEVLVGLGGDDTISGDAGRDTATGGDGRDLIDGDEGDDVLAGEAGNDTLRGGTGQDLITGGSGDDLIDGGEGKDILALTGRASDYSLIELIPHTASTPGTYRITDNCAGSPQGTALITGTELLRFEIGGEITLATMLNRAPTAIDIDRVGDDGPIVSEIAPEGTVVARLRALAPIRMTRSRCPLRRAAMPGGASSSTATCCAWPAPTPSTLPAPSRTS